MRLFFLSFCFFSFVAFVAPATASEGLQFTVNKTVIQESLEGNEEKTQTQQVVTLWPHAFSVEEGQLQTIYDFDKDLKLEIDHSAKVFKEIPLYATVMFRRQELQNRRAMIKMMGQMASSSAVPSLPEMEMLFGMKYDVEIPRKYIQEHRDKSVAFSYKGRDVFSMIFSETQMPKDLRNSYKHYLVYEHRIHPDIREALDGFTVFHSEIFYVVNAYPDSDMKYVYEIENVEVASASNYSEPPSYQRLFSRNQALHVLIEKSLFKATQPHDKTKYVSDARDLLKQEKYLDAFLAASADVLHYENPQIELLEEIFSKAPQNDPAMLVLLYTAVETDDERREAIDIFEKIAEKVELSYGYVLDLWAARYQAQLQNKKESLQSYFKVVKANPYLVGVYKDIGSVLMEMQRVDEAWNAWMAFSALAGDSKMQVSFQKHNLEMKEKYPEYF